MAQKRGLSFSLIRHYDKAIAVVVLAVLLASLFVLARSAAESRKRKDRYQADVSGMRPKHAILAPLSIELYEAAQRNLRSPQTLRQPETGVGLFVPERRVRCVDCLYPIRSDAKECPYCHAQQPAPVVIDKNKLDSEGRGIPNGWRMTHFRHPFAMAEDLSRADDDADGDGFTNLQEYQAGTNPRDPKDHPDLIELMRCREIATRPFPFTLTSAIRMPKGDLQLTFNMRGNDNTHFVKKGDPIGKTGLIYSNCTQKSETILDPRVGTRKVDRYEALLFRPADGKTFTLRDNDAQAPMEQEVVLTLTAGGKTNEYQVAAGGTLELEGQRYKVDVNPGIDSQHHSVVLENLSTAKKSTVNVGML